MLRNQNIICISSIDWDFIWQGHQEIMSVFARNGNRVLFIENTGVRIPGIRDAQRISSRFKNWLKGVKGIRKEMDNLFVYSPLVLPFPYSKAARWINRNIILSVLNKWMKVMDFSNPVIWTFLPTPLSTNIADNIMKKLFIYYCIDNFSASSASAKKIKSSERVMLRKADIVFVTSKELFNHCSEYNKNVYNFPFAVDFKKFEKIRIKDICIPDELKNIKRPIVGYVGGVHKWVDQRLIKEAAEKYREYSFVFVGPIQVDVSGLQSLNNVYFLGKKSHDDIPFFIKYFDVGIIPYLITDYTNNVYPTKLNEYLAFGKPVVSTYLPEIAEFNRLHEGILYTAKDSEEFKKCIDRAINENSKALTDKRIEAARQNSWESRIENMSKLIEEEIERKKVSIEEKWRENLIGFYRAARKKILGLAAGCILLYLLLFNTSFIWLVAGPLNISEAPQKSDAIVVFGGGVGETGSPGKSTIERARYAAELYNKGYADKIIFSSGYTYTYNDAENMKFFAISMGVSEKDIILEQMANSTYENVKFSRRILNKNRFNKVLLVSSPYNMKRVQLVFHKLAKDIKVIYTPVENSQFYNGSEGVRAEQMKAIIHEYFAIVYYLVKGYI